MFANEISTLFSNGIVARLKKYLIHVGILPGVFFDHHHDEGKVFFLNGSMLTILIVKIVWPDFEVNDEHSLVRFISSLA